MKSKIMLMTLILAAASLVATIPAMADLRLVAAANFDSDTPGEFPDTTLPAEPMGDSFSPSSNVGVGTYTVVPSLGDLTNQPLQAVRGSGSGSFNFGPNFPADAYSSESFFIRFRYAPVSGLPYLSAILRGPNLAIHGTLSFFLRDINFSSAFGSQNNISVGSMVYGESVLVEWSLNRTTGEQTLALDGVVVIDAMITGYKASATDATSLVFEGGSQGSMTVAIDDLEIFAGTGTTPVENSTFGSVKALYR